MSAAAGSDHVAVIILDRDVWHVLTMTVMDNGGIFLVSLDFELAQAARDALAGKLVEQRSDLPSYLWPHPTLWGYLATGIRRSVW